MERSLLSPTAASAAMRGAWAGAVRAASAGVRRAIAGNSSPAGHPDQRHAGLADQQQLAALRPASSLARLEALQNSSARGSSRQAAPAYHGAATRTASVSQAASDAAGARIPAAHRELSSDVDADAGGSRAPGPTGVPFGAVVALQSLACGKFLQANLWAAYSCGDSSSEPDAAGGSTLAADSNADGSAVAFASSGRRRGSLNSSMAGLGLSESARQCARVHPFESWPMWLSADGDGSQALRLVMTMGGQLEAASSSLAPLPDHGQGGPGGYDHDTFHGMLRTCLFRITHGDDPHWRGDIRQGDPIALELLLPLPSAPGATTGSSTCSSAETVATRWCVGARLLLPKQTDPLRGRQRLAAALRQTPYESAASRLAVLRNVREAAAAGGRGRGGGSLSLRPLTAGSSESTGSMEDLHAASVHTHWGTQETERRQPLPARASNSAGRARARARTASRLSQLQVDTTAALTHGGAEAGALEPPAAPPVSTHGLGAVQVGLGDQVARGFENHGDDPSLPLDESSSHPADTRLSKWLAAALPMQNCPRFLGEPSDEQLAQTIAVAVSRVAYAAQAQAARSTSSALASARKRVDQLQVAGSSNLKCASHSVVSGPEGNADSEPLPAGNTDTGTGSALALSSCLRPASGSAAAAAGRFTARWQLRLHSSNSNSLARAQADAHRHHDDEVEEDDPPSQAARLESASAWSGTRSRPAARSICTATRHPPSLRHLSVISLHMDMGHLQAKRNRDVPRAVPGTTVTGTQSGTPEVEGGRQSTHTSEPAAPVAVTSSSFHVTPPPPVFDAVIDWETGNTHRDAHALSLTDASLAAHAMSRSCGVAIHASRHGQSGAYSSPPSPTSPVSAAAAVGPASATRGTGLASTGSCRSLLYAAPASHGASGSIAASTSRTGTHAATGAASTGSLPFASKGVALGAAILEAPAAAACLLGTARAGNASGAVRKAAAFEARQALRQMMATTDAALDEMQGRSSTQQQPEPGIERVRPSARLAQLPAESKALAFVYGEERVPGHRQSIATTACTVVESHGPSATASAETTACSEHAPLSSAHNHVDGHNRCANGSDNEKEAAGSDDRDSDTGSSTFLTGLGLGMGAEKKAASAEAVHEARVPSSATTDSNCKTEMQLPLLLSPAVRSFLRGHGDLAGNTDLLPGPAGAKPVGEALRLPAALLRHPTCVHASLPSATSGSGSSSGNACLGADAGALAGGVASASASSLLEDISEPRVGPAGMWRVFVCAPSLAALNRAPQAGPVRSGTAATAASAGSGTAPTSPASYILQDDDSSPGHAEVASSNASAPAAGGCSSQDEHVATSARVAASLMTQRPLSASASGISISTRTASRNGSLLRPSRAEPESLTPGPSRSSSSRSSARPALPEEIIARAQAQLQALQAPNAAAARAAVATMTQRAAVAAQATSLQALRARLAQPRPGAGMHSHSHSDPHTGIETAVEDAARSRRHSLSSSGAPGHHHHDDQHHVPVPRIDSEALNGEAVSRMAEAEAVGSSSLPVVDSAQLHRRASLGNDREASSPAPSPSPSPGAHGGRGVQSVTNSLSSCPRPARRDSVTAPLAADAGTAAGNSSTGEFARQRRSRPTTPVDRRGVAPLHAGRRSQADVTLAPTSSTPTAATANYSVSSNAQQSALAAHDAVQQHLQLLHAEAVASALEAAVPCAAWSAMERDTPLSKLAFAGAAQARLLQMLAACEAIREVDAASAAEAVAEAAEAAQHAMIGLAADRRKQAFQVAPHMSPAAKARAAAAAEAAPPPTATHEARLASVFAQARAQGRRKGGGEDELPVPLPPAIQRSAQHLRPDSAKATGPTDGRPASAVPLRRQGAIGAISRPSSAARATEQAAGAGAVAGKPSSAARPPTRPRSAGSACSASASASASRRRFSFIFTDGDEAREDVGACEVAGAGAQEAHRAFVFPPSPSPSTPASRKSHRSPSRQSRPASPAGSSSGSVAAGERGSSERESVEEAAQSRLAANAARVLHCLRTLLRRARVRGQLSHHARWGSLLRSHEAAVSGAVAAGVALPETTRTRMYAPSHNPHAAVAALSPLAVFAAGAERNAQLHGNSHSDQDQSEGQDRPDSEAPARLRSGSGREARGFALAPLKTELSTGAVPAWAAPPFAGSASASASASANVAERQVNSVMQLEGSAAGSSANSSDGGPRRVSFIRSLHTTSELSQPGLRHWTGQGQGESQAGDHGAASSSCPEASGAPRAIVMAAPAVARDLVAESMPVGSPQQRARRAAALARVLGFGVQAGSAGSTVTAQGAQEAGAAEEDKDAPDDPRAWPASRAAPSPDRRDRHGAPSLGASDAYFTNKRIAVPVSAPDALLSSNTGSSSVTALLDTLDRQKRATVANLASAWNHSDGRPPGSRSSGLPVALPLHASNNEPEAGSGPGTAMATAEAGKHDFAMSGAAPTPTPARVSMAESVWVSSDPLPPALRFTPASAPRHVLRELDRQARLTAPRRPMSAVNLLPALMSRPSAVAGASIDAAEWQLLGAEHTSKLAAVTEAYADASPRHPLALPLQSAAAFGAKTAVGPLPPLPAEAHEGLGSSRVGVRTQAPSRIMAGKAAKAAHSLLRLHRNAAPTPSATEPEVPSARARAGAADLRKCAQLSSSPGLSLSASVSDLLPADFALRHASRVSASYSAASLACRSFSAILAAGAAAGDGSPLVILPQRHRHSGSRLGKRGILSSSASMQLHEAAWAESVRPPGSSRVWSRSR